MSKLILLIKKGAPIGNQNARKNKDIEASNQGGKKDFLLLSDVLETGKSMTAINKDLGEIAIDKGQTGKKGYGLLHIIEERVSEGKSVEETAAVIHLVVQAAREGKITSEVKYQGGNGSDIGRYGIEKDGIIAIVSKQRFGKNEKFVITGFDNRNKKEEAAEAIQTVIAQHDRSPEFSGFRKQVGAAVSSMVQVSPSPLKKSTPKMVLKIRKSEALRIRLGGLL
jgi:hypothetical protein